MTTFQNMFTGEQISQLFEQLGVTHVVTVPDSTVGQWQQAIEQRGTTRVVRVCREGEAWEVAAGLELGGARPLVMIQCTGFFESGDAIRNVLHDWKLPIASIIGYRSYLSQETLPGDTCLVFTEPLLDAWRIDYRLLTKPTDLGVITEHLGACRAANKPGAIVVAEGKA
jgi:sulfopyruvate decarboxylase TPP-binding subunit